MHVSGTFRVVATDQNAERGRGCPFNGKGGVRRGGGGRVFGKQSGFTTQVVHSEELVVTGFRRREETERYIVDMVRELVRRELGKRELVERESTDRELMERESMEWSRWTVTVSELMR